MVFHLFVVAKTPLISAESARRITSNVDSQHSPLPHLMTVLMDLSLPLGFPVLTDGIGTAFEFLKDSSFMRVIDASYC